MPRMEFLVCTGHRVQFSPLIDQHHAARFHLLPDRQAAIFWLKYRRPEQWSDKQELDVRSQNVHVILQPEDANL